MNNTPLQHDLTTFLFRTCLLCLAALQLMGTALPAADTVVLPEPIPAHPRLLVSNEDWERLRKQVKSDPVSARLFLSLEKAAKQILLDPPATREMVGRRLLATSRLVLQRISTLALVYQVTGEKAYAERAIQEMLAAAGFPDWNPSHFLDVAEMSLGLAIGYDWLHGQMSASERQQVAAALITKGLKPSLPGTNSWITGENNWNQVCHSGMSAAAIAVADLEPELAAQILNRAVANVPKSGHGYAPDGAYPEGPMYWGYGTTLHVVLAAALQRLSGTAYGLDRMPGFRESARYLDEVTAPSGLFFNYSDSNLQRGLEVALFWFARNFHEPDRIDYDLKKLDELLLPYDTKNNRAGGLRLLAMALVWRDPSLKERDPAPANRSDWLGRGQNAVAIHRSASDRPPGIYLGLKGGSPSLSHAHMDAGSFILESDGVRWAIDLGMQAYESLESKGIKLWSKAQDGERWGVFRLGPESHNILRFNAAPQAVGGQGNFVRFQSGGTNPHSVLDLSTIYRDQVKEVFRGVAVLNNSSVLFQDEWTAGEKPVDVTWQMLTRAKVSVVPGGIKLEQDGKSLTLRILESDTATVEVRDVKDLQKAFDAENPGVQRIVIGTNTESDRQGRFRILAIPGSSSAGAAPDLEKLKNWSKPLAP